MTDTLELAIIGAGKVGKSLAQLLMNTDHNVKLIGRTIDQQRAAVQTADVTLLTVNDDAIQPLCDSLADCVKPGSIVAHCSGALSSAILNSAKTRGALTASAHPLNSFPNLAAALDTFSDPRHGSYLYAEGDDRALTTLLPLFNALGFCTHAIEAEQKIAYHAACVFICNYLTALIELGLLTAENAGIDREQFWRAVQPLIHTTLTNISDHGTAAALSGPIARGDTTTVANHLAALVDGKSAYLALGHRALALAAQSSRLSEQQIENMRALLIENATDVLS